MNALASVWCCHGQKTVHLRRPDGAAPEESEIGAAVVAEFPDVPRDEVLVERMHFLRSDYVGGRFELSQLGPFVRLTGPCDPSLHSCPA